MFQKCSRLRHQYHIREQVLEKFSGFGMKMEEDWVFVGEKVVPSFGFVCKICQVSSVPKRHKGSEIQVIKPVQMAPLNSRKEPCLLVSGKCRRVHTQHQDTQTEFLVKILILQYCIKFAMILSVVDCLRTVYLAYVGILEMCMTPLDVELPEACCKTDFPSQSETSRNEINFKAKAGWNSFQKPTKSKNSWSFEKLFWVLPKLLAFVVMCIWAYKLGACDTNSEALFSVT